jgi:hypothetical protein
MLNYLGFFLLLLLNYFSSRLSFFDFLYLITSYTVYYAMHSIATAHKHIKKNRHQHPRHRHYYFCF